jgi:hypothetical protein
VYVALCLRNLVDWETPLYSIRAKIGCKQAGLSAQTNSNTRHLASCPRQRTAFGLQFRRSGTAVPRKLFGRRWRARPRRRIRAARSGFFKPVRAGTGMQRTPLGWCLVPWKLLHMGAWARFGGQLAAFIAYRHGYYIAIRGIRRAGCLLLGASV